MKKITFKQDKCYLVRFLDHTSGTKDIVEVEIVAWFLEEHKHHVVFSSWRIDDEDKDLVDNNHEPISLIKRCIINAKELQIPKWKKTH